MTTSKAYRAAHLDKDSPSDLGVVLAIRRRAIGRRRPLVNYIEVVFVELSLHSDDESEPELGKSIGSHSKKLAANKTVSTAIPARNHGC
jgi:hypothetical protein